MARVLRRAQWEGEVVRSGNMDKIMVQNLEVVVNAGFDVWGRQKKQRALISVTLTLGEQFDSASSTDSVDESTVHYGTLSKAIQQEFNDNHAPWIGTAELATRVARCVSRVAKSAEVYAIETEICYIKGSMFGEGAGYVFSSIENSKNRSEVLYLRDIRIPCLIGVNSNERLQKQPVVVNAWIDKVARSRVDMYPELESLLFKLISDSSFQTIESLLAWLVDELRDQFFTKEADDESWIRLRISKPQAVPFADAPAVEIMRPVRVE